VRLWDFLYESKSSSDAREAFDGAALDSTDA
jgi:hypothetical protein